MRKYSSEEHVEDKNDESAEATDSDTTVDSVTFDSVIEETATKIQSINTIKEEICKLPLNLCEKEYIDNCITPILDITSKLSAISINLANSVNVLTTSPIVTRKKSKIKDTIDLIYDLNEQCENTYDAVKKRIDRLLKSIN
jgi:hypothetical protein